jgi:hypothetical protein
VLRSCPASPTIAEEKAGLRAGTLTASGYAKSVVLNRLDEFRFFRRTPEVSPCRCRDG